MRQIVYYVKTFHYKKQFSLKLIFQNFFTLRMIKILEKNKKQSIMLFKNYIYIYILKYIFVEGCRKENEGIYNL